MDNVTHTVAGLLLGEAAVQLRARRAPPSPAFRLAAAVAGAVGANLPDGDLLYTSFGAGPLAYLLHHRGHTHTVPAALLGAVLLWAGALAVWRSRRAAAAPDEGDRRWLLGLALAALLSHLALDFTNSYGVHPFWPVDNRWYYGDAVFIVEPWLWVAAVPALIFASPRRWARLLLGAVLAGGLALAWGVSMVPWGAALALTLGAALLLAAAWRLAPPARVALALGVWGAATAAFALGSQAARAAVLRAASDPAVPDERLRVVDAVITPAPANPLCATAIVVQAGGGRYRVATARVAALPAILPAARCRPAPPDAAPLGPAGLRSTRAVRWAGEWEAPAGELAALARGNCEVAAMLRFVRVPVWTAAGPAALDFGDLRYAGRERGSFAERRVAVRPDRCPEGVPPWRPPRADLLAVPLAGLR